MDPGDGEQPRAARAGRRARPLSVQADEQENPSISGRHQDSDLGSPPAPMMGSAFGGAPTQQAPEANGWTSGGGGPPPRRAGFGSDTGAAQAPASATPTSPSGPAPDPLADSGGVKFTGVSRRKQEQQVAEEQEKARGRSRYEELTTNADIMEIPELEEEGKEDLTRVVAEAPKVRNNKVQDINELDEDMHFKLPSTDDRDIDLSLLTAVLCSSEQVQEMDEIWDPDMLFAQVASELNQEKEQAAGGADGEAKEAEPMPAPV